MRVVVIGPAHPYKGGPTNHATELARRLDAAGHAVTVESWSAQYPKLLYPGQLTVDTPEVPLFNDTRRELSWRRPDGWRRVGRKLGRSVDVVVIFVYSPVQVPAYLSIVRAIRRSGGARVVALCNNVLPHEGGALSHRTMRMLYRRVDGMLVHSAAQAALAHSLAPVPVAEAALPPHLPLPEMGEPRSTSAALHRRLLFFGMVRPYKGLDVLLRALAAGPPDVTLVVAGEFWGGTAKTTELVEELGLSKRVELRAGFVDASELPTLFGSADALVLPYRAATASQNAMIAFEYGLPVIATRAGALADLVVDGVNGLTCLPDDVDDLARAITAFYRAGQPEHLRAGVQRVDPEPLWAAYVDALMGLTLNSPGHCEDVGMSVGVTEER
jgi:glycosyltransferase involved in cell wall biosynthesis